MEEIKYTTRPCASPGFERDGLPQYAVPDPLLELLSIVTAAMMLNVLNTLVA